MTLFLPFDTGIWEPPHGLLQTPPRAVNVNSPAEGESEEGYAVRGGAEAVAADEERLGKRHAR